MTGCIIIGSGGRKLRNQRLDTMRLDQPSITPSLCGLSRVDIRDEGNDGVEDALRDGARVGLVNADQTIARVGHNVAVNDFAAHDGGQCGVGSR